MTPTPLYGESYISGNISWWHSNTDRRFWFAQIMDELFDYPTALLVIDDFGNLVRVGRGF